MGGTQSRYRWVILGTGLITQFFSYGIWYAFPVFFVAVLDELGWPRGAAAGAFSTLVVIAACTGPLVGSLTEHAGPRIVIPTGAALVAVGMIGCAFVTELWQFYLFYGVIGGLGLGLAGWISNVTAISRWFPRSVASATGFTSAGVGLSILVLAPLMQVAISLVGWRPAFLILAGLNLVLVPLNLALHRALPRMGADDPDGATATGSGRRAARATISTPSLIVDRVWTSRAWTLRPAAHTIRFWLLFVGFFGISFAAQLIIVHEVAFLVDHGFTAAMAATAAGLVGLGSVPSKMLNGAISDRIGRETMLTVDVALLLVGLLLLVVAGSGPVPALLYVFPILVGAGHASVAVIAPAMAADLFKGPSFGAIFGTIACGCGLGGAAGAWAAGVIFDATGSYSVAFTVAAVACITSVACGWLAAPRRVRRVPHAWHVGRPFHLAASHHL